MPFSTPSCFTPPPPPRPGSAPPHITPSPPPPPPPPPPPSFTPPPPSVWYTAHYHMTLSRLTAVARSLSLLTPLSTSAADSVAWYSPDWTHRQKITVNHELVGGSVDGFPMLVKLTGGVFEHAQEDGDDILFTAADGTTKLLHEIESMNGEVVAWVQMPNLSEIEDTVLFVYYGNPTAENQQSVTNVWGNGYAGVWHLNND